MFRNKYSGLIEGHSHPLYIESELSDLKNQLNNKDKRIGNLEKQLSCKNKFIMFIITSVLIPCILKYFNISFY